MLIEKENGETVKVAIPYTLWQAFGNEYILAMMTAGELLQAAYAPPEGKA